VSQATSSVSKFTEQASAAAAAEAPAPLASLRQDGAAAFARLGFPTTRDEDWHYTSPAPIADATFVAATDRTATTLADAAVLAPYVFGGRWPLVVFLNGRFAPELSSISALPEGVRVWTLAQAAEQQPELLQRYLGHAVPADRDGFSALNAAFAGEGTLIHVAKEMVSDTPVHLLHVVDAQGAGTMSHPRHVIVGNGTPRRRCGEPSAADVAYFTNTVTDVLVEDGATLNHSRIQREAGSAFHVGTIEARQGRDSHFIQFSFQTGARLSRSNVYTVLNGDGCGTTLNGLYMLDAHQHGDHQTRVEHVAPNCFSRELYKGLLDGTARRSTAKCTCARSAEDQALHQQHVVVTESADRHKPQLEIFADDVKCTHGATVGRIDEMALFYLKSRGIGNVLSKQLLMYAFAADVLETIENTEVREELERMTMARFTGV
jgi:Fe-S cluster assembly protein SufD